MSLTELITAGTRPAKSPKDGALKHYPTGESAGDSARRLAADCLVLDCETTGLGKGARIWELATEELEQMVTKETKREGEGGNQVIANPNPPSFASLPSVRSWLFNPGLLAPTQPGIPFEWEPEAYRMAEASLDIQCEDSGLDGGLPSMIQFLAGKPIFATHAEEIVNLLAGRNVVAWNAEFDQRMLQQEFARVGFSKFSQRWQTIRWYDAMGLYLAWRREIGRGLENPNGPAHRLKLVVACDLEGIAIDGHHRAAQDVQMTVKLLRRISGLPTAHSQGAHS